MKAEIASSAKFLETNDPLYSRIRRTHRVQNELQEKQSRSALALYLGTLEKALMLRVRNALETRGHAPIALICGGVLFLENQPLSGDSLQEMCDEVGVTVCAKELAWAPPSRGRAILVGAVTCERVRVGPNAHRLRLDSRPRMPRFGLFHVALAQGSYCRYAARPLRV